ncbi:TIM barrel protein [uncultured Gimesia sp.]|uniref:hydroxypyruvate isomerase family protein n=1 Tax=uncultured Gimesia sp. TaxID=1678688 RepID=UPI0030D771C6
MKSKISRRKLLQRSGVVAASAFGLGVQQSHAGESKEISTQPLKGNINQSVVHWCFKKYWDLEKTAQIASQLGIKSVELTPSENWATLKKYGLTCAISSSHGFKVGFNNPENWNQCIEILRKRIDECEAGGVKNVITFTGMRDGISDEEGAKNCVAGFKKIIGYAEKKKVNLCLEMLNSRDDSHPMKGHPGYQGDHTEYCIDIIKQVGSDRMKLLFDIYHVQIMDGDVIRRLREHKDYIGHVHTAGNPGRGELDEKQEINYPAIMLALQEIGYQGYVGQEFIPTRDPYQGLKQAVELCDV